MMAANEARQEGYGGIARVSRACGLSRLTIAKGMRELEEAPVAAGRIRRPGGGRHRLLVRDPELPRMLESLVEPLARGDKKAANGFRNRDNFKIAIYFHCGGLNLYPDPTH